MTKTRTRTKTWEVVVTYSGTNTYYVKANNKEEAEEAALARYLDGDNGEQTGAEEERIDRMSTEELTP